MKDFETIYKERPDQNESGSSGYSTMRNLYDICTRLNPQLIVESGTWKGNSSWLFSHWDDVWCYDIDFSNLRWMGDGIRYIECDIQQEEIDSFYVGDDWLDTLFFFDDHISHLQRLQWLIKIGAKYAVFDDNQPEDIANTLKNPPTPTLEMLKEEMMSQHDFHIFNRIKRYEVMPFYGNRRNFDTRLTYIEL